MWRKKSATCCLRTEVFPQDQLRLHFPIEADSTNSHRPYYDNNLGENKYPGCQYQSGNELLIRSFGSEATTPVMKSWVKKVRPVVDSVLQKYDARRIITGHTVIADKITTHYDHKVINTDVKHAEGNSEALLIEGNQFYRNELQGEKFLLFVDEKQKK